MIHDLEGLIEGGIQKTLLQWYTTNIYKHMFFFFNVKKIFGPIVFVTTRRVIKKCKGEVRKD